MGKTLGTIIEIGGAIALAATGIGAIGDLAAFGTLAGASFGSIALGTLAIGGIGAISIGQGLGGTLFGPKSPKPATMEQAIRQAYPVRVSGYGPNRRTTIVIR